MSKRIMIILVIGLSVAFCTIICEPADAQFSNPGIQHYYNLIGQMQALKSFNQKPVYYNNNNTNNNARYFQNTVSLAELARRPRLSEASAANDKGLDFYKKEDWANAVTFFQEAADKDPDDLVIRDNLAKAKLHLQIQQDEQLRIRQQEQQNKADVGNIQHAVQTFTQTLNAIPSSGALDFDQQHTASANSNGNSLGFMSNGSSTPQTTIAPDLQFYDAKIVDARNVSSGLPKFVDNAIADAYSKAPEGVSDRVRKGFQAVTDHDWILARAWFEDALNHDPDNAGLQRLVELADYTEKRIKQVSSDKTTGTSSTKTAIVLPKVSDIQYLFPGWEPVQPTVSAKGKKMQLPKDSDIQFLFPGLAPNPAREMNDYMFEQALKATKNDAVLIKLSNGAGHVAPAYPVN